MNLFRKILYRLLPIKKNKIVFSTMGDRYGCNPKHICEEIIRRKLPYDLVWITNKNVGNTSFPSKVRTVLAGKKADKERASCRIMINNTRTNYFRKGFSKKNGQIYIQTWHGAYGIKKMEGDCVDTLSPEWLEQARTDSANIDCLLSASAWDTQTFKRCFFCSHQVIHETGMPRNDVFFDESGKYAARVREYYGLDSDVKILLYAPTFRDDLKCECYGLDCNRLREVMIGSFGGKWVIMSRLHSHVAALHDEVFSDNGVINASVYPDMQELLAASDVLISDYSSCMFDFALTRRPCFIFATDIEKYNTERGFNYPLEKTPFPIAVSNEQLLENIRTFDSESYRLAVDGFFREKGSCDDGHAAERVVDYIVELMK